MAESPGGEIQGIGLTTFLQMVQNENATCTLTVESDQLSGRLFVVDGQLVDAETDTLRGPKAAYELIALVDPVIRMDQGCDRSEDTIQMPLMQLLMEGTRLMDEREGDGLPGFEGIDDPGIGTDPLSSDQAAEQHYSDWVSLDSGPSLQGDEKEESPPFPVDESGSPSLYGESSPEERHLSRTETILAEAARATRRRRILVAICALFLLFGSGAFFFWYADFTEKKSHDSLIASVDALPSLEQKEAVLDNFLEAYPDSKYKGEVRANLNAVRSKIVTRDFQMAMNRVEEIENTPETLETALRIINRFLIQHPRGKQANTFRTYKEDRIRDASMVLMDRIRESERDPFDRLSDAREYQRLFQTQPEAKEARDFITTLADSELTAWYALPCDSESETRDCLKRLDLFITRFPDHPDAGMLQGRKPELLVQLRMRELEREATEEKTPTAAHILQFYSAAQNTEKDPEVVTSIKKLLPKLAKQADQEREFERLDNQLKRTALTVPVQINVLERYLAGNPSEPYRSDMLARLDQLKLFQSRTKEAREKAEKERIRAEREARERELRQMLQANSARIQTALTRARALLSKGGGRFVTTDNETVLDQQTGKIWTLADSEAYTGRKLNYREAKRYAEEARVGGFTDWRLPTPRELATLFKNPPYFHSPTPERGYWTQEVVTKGYRNKVTTISAKPEPVLQKIGLSPEVPGYALLVRN